MISTISGKHASVFDALTVIREADRRVKASDETTVEWYRKNIDLIIASASGAVAAASLPRDEMLDRATSRVA
jgi:hypothetical protein